MRPWRCMLVSLLSSVRTSNMVRKARLSASGASLGTSAPSMPEPSPRIWRSGMSDSTGVGWPRAAPSTRQQPGGSLKGRLRGEAKRPFALGSGALVRDGDLFRVLGVVLEVEEDLLDEGEVLR